MIDTIVEEELVIKVYPVQTLPAYRRPLVEKLICAAMNENTEFEDFDRIAVELLDIMTPDMLAEHHLPESHD